MLLVEVLVDDAAAGAPTKETAVNNMITGLFGAHLWDLGENISWYITPHPLHHGAAAAIIVRRGAVQRQ